MSYNFVSKIRTRVLFFLVPLGQTKPFCAITVIAIIPHPLATSEAIP